MTTYNVYRRNTVSDVPVAIATELTSKSYSDTTAIKGITYLYSVGAVKNGIEKVSDEISRLAGEAWTPTNLSSQPKVYLLSDNVVVDSSNRVSQLNDISGNNNNFTQSSDTLKPIYIDGVIRFDGVDDRLSSANLNLFKNISDAWIFTVYKKRGLTTSSIGHSLFYADVDGTNINRFFLIAKRASTGLTSFAARTLLTDTTSVISSPTIRDGTTMMAYAQARYSTGTTKLRTNAIDDATGTITASLTSNVTASAINIGYGKVDGAGDVDVSAIILGTGSVPSSDEIKKLEGWAAHKYELTANLPSDHPYKTNPPVQ